MPTNNDNIEKCCMSTGTCCTFTGLSGLGVYAWVQYMFYLKSEGWDDAGIALLSLLGPGEAAVGAAAAIGTAALGCTLYGIYKCCQAAMPEARKPLLPTNV